MQLKKIESLNVDDMYITCFNFFISFIQISCIYDISDAHFLKVTFKIL